MQNINKQPKNQNLQEIVNVIILWMAFFFYYLFLSDYLAVTITCVHNVTKESQYLELEYQKQKKMSYKSINLGVRVYV